ncbi:hypothetical protein M5D96_013655 [Drosophila gunungcola]|uniref:Uncharacterized protein n=1 Tax=Drosophila gunungcola TaxID=103775 RepID=A0A9Q0BI89_9MUSC|nr:hypothetical protein M5D96_013655 [Drosophila gunungcola]
MTVPGTGKVLRPTFILMKHYSSHKEGTVTASQTILKTFDWPSLNKTYKAKSMAKKMREDENGQE